MSVTYNVYACMCVFYIPPYFDRVQKESTFWEISFHVICCKAQRDFKINVERSSDTSYQGEFSFLKGTKFETVLKFKN